MIALAISRSPSGAPRPATDELAGVYVCIEAEETVRVPAPDHPSGSSPANGADR
jgi:hypothetical protein